ncbi:uncharacterized protein LOC132274032 [Cornus florida]|uniref:uncharacterized protein LOC132274032 n=1 Tax=Cornus florida TaxID=4283 RepID=UPI00289F3C0D|nr:uncharacterized protein LOC132274032 [Cornus florida]
MSWFARTIANSLRIDDDDEDDDHTTPNPKQSQFQQRHQQELEEQDDGEDEDRIDSHGRGVKEDLSEFKQTLTRQLWGVASFLAPPAGPPPPPPPPPSPTSYRHTHRSVSDRSRWESYDRSGSGDVSDEDGLESETCTDFDERIRSGMYDLSNDNAVPEFSRGVSEDGIEAAVGVTDEVLAFAMNIAHHPETWLDFPSFEEEGMDDFDISDAQNKHALAVERLAPRLAALRIELCPAHMSDAYFWKVYFVLLHSRLNKHDADLLSTPQIVEARTMWMQELQKRKKVESDWFGRSTSYSKESPQSWQDDFGPPSSDDTPRNMSHGAFTFEPSTYSATTEFETDKHPVVTSEIQIIDKSVIEEEPVIKTRVKDFVAGPSLVPAQKYDEDDDWLEDNSELDGYSGAAFVGDGEDVSFSDLEDDADSSVPIKSKIGLKGLDKSTRLS